MKIAYLTTSFVPSVAANCVQVMKMAQALGRLGHDVTLYAAYGGPEEPFGFYGVTPNFTLARAERTKGGKLGAARYLAVQSARLLSGPPADLYFGRVARLLLAAAPRGRRLRYEAHALPAPGPRREVQRALFALPNFDRLVCISGTLADDYAAAFPSLDRDAILVAHDGADPLDLDAPVVEGWPGRPGGFNVGYIGGIYPGRGIETIVDAAAELPEIDFQIVGGDARTVAWWREECPLPNVHFHGHVPHAHIARYYTGMDALVAPFGDKVSVHGGAGDTSRWMSPLKIFEYMSTGRPIVCSDMPVLREVLRDGENSVLLPSKDTSRWIETLRDLATNPDRCRQLGSTAQADFQAHYTWTRRAELIAAP